MEQSRKEDVEVLNKKLLELRTQFEVLQKKINRGVAEPQTVDNNLAARLKRLEIQDAANQQIIKSQKKEISDLKSELQTFKKDYHHQQHRGIHSGHLPRHTSVSGRETQGIGCRHCMHVQNCLQHSTP